MAGKRRRFSPEFKSRVARAALREDKTIAELASQFGVHPNQVTQWNKQALEALPDAFSSGKKSGPPPAQDPSHLYQEIGKLQVELGWLKKKAGELGVDC